MKTRIYNVEKQMTIEQSYFWRIVESIIEQLGDATIEDVKDVSKDPKYYKKDIDVLIKDITYEIKIDSYDTGFCFLETISNSKTGALGWLFVSQAKWLVYSFPRQGVAYIADTKKLREWFLDNINWYIENEQQRRVGTEREANPNKPGDEGYKYFSFGFLVGLSLLESEGIFKKFNLIPA